MDKEFETPALAVKSAMQSASHRETFCKGTMFDIDPSRKRGGNTMAKESPAPETPAPAVPECDFRAYLLGGPKVDDFEIEREFDTGRPVELEASADE